MRQPIPSIPIEKYQKLSLEGRRKYYLKHFPQIKILEDKILKHGGDRIIYLPEIENLNKLLTKAKIIKNIPVVPFRSPSMCHLLSQSFFCEGMGHWWHGYTLNNDDGLWRCHSWVQDFNGKYIEVTGILRDLYFGFRFKKGEVGVKWDLNLSSPKGPETSVFIRNFSGKF